MAKSASFSYFYRSYLGVNSKLDSWIESYKFKSLFFGEPPIFDCFGSFKIESSCMVWRIRIKANTQPFASSHLHREWQTYTSEFVSPPIRKGGTSPMLGNFVSNLVAFQYMLKTCYANAEGFHCSKEDQDFILPV